MKYFRLTITWIVRVLDDLISLLYPQLCCACGTDLYEGESELCIKCLNNLPYTDHHFDSENKTIKKLWGKVQVNAAMSLLYFKKGGRVQRMIHQLKYKHHTQVGIRLGQLIAERLIISPHFGQIDLVLPVPLHRSKLRSRGYNQSEFIAKGIAKETHALLDLTTLQRKRATSTQTRKTRFERYENMRDVFYVNKPEALYGKHILLVDDVVTTGATLESCIAELQRCGINNISVAAAAFAD